MLVVAYATGRAFHARQVKGDDPDEKGYPGPPGWGLGMRLTISHCKKKYCYETSGGGQGPPRAAEPMMMMMMSTIMYCIVYILLPVLTVDISCKL